MNDFALEKMLLPIFRRQCIITVKNNLIEPKGFNLKEVPGRSYKIFNPVFTAEKRQLAALLEVDTDVIYLHLLAVRQEAYDLLEEQYFFIRGYRVGHTLEGDTIVVIVSAQVRGGCYIIDENGDIDGGGKGRWYVVLCPSDAESELVADLKAEEANRRKSLPQCCFERVENTHEVDTSDSGV